MNPLSDQPNLDFKNEDLYTPFASPLELYEFKMLQEYTQRKNLQTLENNQLPHLRKQLLLIKFFKLKKNQLVEVISRSSNGLSKNVARVDTVGKDFVMLKTFFSRIWIPYAVIHSAKKPIQEFTNSQQHIVIDIKLRKKMISFGKSIRKDVNLKEPLLLVKQLVAWEGTRLTVYTNKPMKGKLVKTSSKKIYLQHATTYDIATESIMYIKQERFTLFLNRLFALLTKYKSSQKIKGLRN